MEIGNDPNIHFITVLPSTVKTRPLERLMIEEYSAESSCWRSKLRPRIVENLICSMVKAQGTTISGGRKVVKNKRHRNKTQDGCDDGGNQGTSGSTGKG